jgi:hypothetical protein
MKVDCYEGETEIDALIRGIIGSAACISAGAVLAALTPVPVVPPFGGPTARLRRAGRGPRNGQSPPTRPRCLRLARELPPALPEQSVRHAAFRDDHNRYRRSISAPAPPFSAPALGSNSPLEFLSDSLLELL